MSNIVLVYSHWEMTDRAISQRAKQAKPLGFDSLEELRDHEMNVKFEEEFAYTGRPIPKVFIDSSFEEDETKEFEKFCECSEVIGQHARSMEPFACLDIQAVATASERTGSNLDNLKRDNQQQQEKFQEERKLHDEQMKTIETNMTMMKR
jgi:hypothetical protein